MRSIIFGNSPVSLFDSLYITIVSMGIVFLVLWLISTILSFFKYIPGDKDQTKKKDNSPVKPTIKNVIKSEGTSNNIKVIKEAKVEESQKFRPEDVKDKTMLIAMMVASIEAAADNEDAFVRVKSIREIA